MSGSSEKPSKQTVKTMNAATEVRDFLSAVPRQHSDTRESWLRRAGAFFGLTPRRARSVWYREKVRIDHDEYLRMRARIGELQKAQIKRRELIADVDALVGARTGLVGGEARSSRDIGGSEVRAGGEAAGHPGDPAPDGEVLGEGGPIDGRKGSHEG